MGERPPDIMKDFSTLVMIGCLFWLLVLAGFVWR